MNPSAKEKFYIGSRINFNSENTNSTVPVVFKAASIKEAKEQWSLGRISVFSVGDVKSIKSSEVKKLLSDHPEYLSR